MCGTVARNDVKIDIQPGAVIPKDWLRTVNNKEFNSDVFVSSHRFITIERLPWWVKQLKGELFYCLLDIGSFRERQKMITMPDNTKVVGVIHKDIRNEDIQMRNKYCISILTQASATISEDPDLNLINREVEQTHHRMPVLRKVI